MLNHPPTVLPVSDDRMSAIRGAHTTDVRARHRHSRRNRGSVILTIDRHRRVGSPTASEGTRRREAGGLTRAPLQRNHLGDVHELLKLEGRNSVVPSVHILARRVRQIGNVTEARVDAFGILVVRPPSRIHRKRGWRANTLRARERKSIGTNRRHATRRDQDGRRWVEESGRDAVTRGVGPKTFQVATVLLVMPPHPLPPVPQSSLQLV